MTTIPFRAILLVASLYGCAVWLTFSPSLAHAATDPSETIDFATEIAPILLTNCSSCHDQKTKEGGYAIDTVSHLFTAGDSGIDPIVASDVASELLRRLRTEDESERMPAKSPPLPEQTIARIESWIKQGAQVNVDRDKPLASLAPESTFTPPEHYPHALPVSAISATPDGSSVVVDGYGEVLFWNLADSTLTARLPVQGRRVSDIEISSDGNFMAVASGNPGVNGSVQMFVLAPAEIWEQKLNLPLPEMSLDISISPDSRFTLIGTGGGSLILLNNADGKEVFKLDSHAAAITAVAWSKDSSKFYSASRDRTAKSYNAKTGEIIGSFAEHERTVGGVAESYNGAYTLEESGRLSTWIEGISSHIISQDRSFSPRVSKLIRVDNQIMVLEPHKLKVMNHVSEQVPDGTDKEGKPKTKWTNRFENSYQLDAQAKKLMCFSILSSGDQLKVFAGTSDGTVLVWEPAQSKDIQTTLVCRP